MTTNISETQWGTIATTQSVKRNMPEWMPEEDRHRIEAYLKYDEMYWNDPKQYQLRVMEGESPIYIPNPRVIVNTTSHFLMKGLELTCQDKTTKEALTNFLDREEFYSRFHQAKKAGVARGDFVFHLTADPNKPANSRISLTSVPAMDVYPIWDEDMPGRMVGAYIAIPYVLPVEEDPEQKTMIRRLKYELKEDRGTRRIWREEAIYEVTPGNFLGSKKLKKKKTILEGGFLDPRITQIPIYWFKNQAWDGEDFGSSELRGMERISEVVSQGTTDISGSLALEGLGVYATDGGRPLIETSNGEVIEGEWEVAPGRVMEVPQGSYFKRVEGVGSITPASEQVSYLEKKLHEALGMTDVALGSVDAQVAESGIALSIKFLPTLAKIEEREEAMVARLKQLFYDWKIWFAVFEQVELSGDIVPVLGEKLPRNRASIILELNNMKDRSIISKAYYRKEMEKLGYEFPTNMEQEILDEIQRENQARTFVSPTEHENGIDNEGLKNANQTSQKKIDETSNSNGDTLPSFGNNSNNKDRPNESGGTESK